MNTQGHRVLSPLLEALKVEIILSPTTTLPFPNPNLRIIAQVTLKHVKHLMFG